MYPGTMLVTEAGTEQINRALLDLLKKINDISLRVDNLTAEVRLLARKNSQN
jgi:hypothetical protein